MKKSIKAIYIMPLVIYMLLISLISLRLESLTILVIGLLFMILNLLIGSLILKTDYKYIAIAFIFMITGTSYTYFVNEVYEDINGIPYYTSAYNDDQKFEIIARDYNKSEKNIFEYIEVNSYVPGLQYGVYIFIIGKIMAFSDMFDGFNTFSIKILHIAFLAIVLMLLIKYLKYERKLEEKLIYIFIGMFMLIPNLLYIASFTFREVIGLTVSVLFFVVVSKSISKINENKIPFQGILLMLILLYLQFNIREIVAFVMIIFLLIILILNLKNLKTKFLIIISSIVVMFPFANLIISFFILSSEYIEEYAAYRNTAGGGIEGIIKNTSILPFGIFIRFIYGFFTPSPGFGYIFNDTPFLFNLINTFNGMGTILILCLIPFFILGINKNKSAFIFWFLLYCIYLNSLTFRHIVLMYPFLLLIIIEGIKVFIKNKKSNSSFLYLAYVVMIITVFTIFSFTKF